MSELKGVYGVFRHPDDLIHAAKKTTERDYDSWDCFTPYPVHGLDPAMGLSRSWLPWVTLTFAMIGLTTAITLQVSITTFNWPMNFGGRPSWRSRILCRSCSNCRCSLVGSRPSSPSS